MMIVHRECLNSGQATVRIRRKIEDANRIPRTVLHVAEPQGSGQGHAVCGGLLGAIDAVESIVARLSRLVRRKTCVVYKSGRHCTASWPVVYDVGGPDRLTPNGRRCRGFKKMLKRLPPNPPPSSCSR